MLWINLCRGKLLPLASLAAGLFALKFRTTIQRGIDVPADFRWLETVADAASGRGAWLTPAGWATLLTRWNGQWDAEVIRVANTIFETAVIVVIVGLLSRCLRESRPAQLVLAASSVVQLIIAFTCPVALFESWDSLWVAVLEATALIVLGFLVPRKTPVVGRWRVIAQFLLAGALVFGFHRGIFRTGETDFPLAGEPRAAAVRQYLQDGNPNLLRGIPPAELVEVTQRLKDPGVRRLLPFSARPTLSTDGWTEGASGFVSLYARCDDNARDAGSVVLEQPDGRRVEPLQGRVPADHRWHRLNFPAPPGRFLVKPLGAVHVRSVVEYAAGSHAVGKLLWSWPAWAVAAVLFASLSFACSPPKFTLAEFELVPTQVELRCLPIFALASYLLLMSAHLDTIAGGADAAGYLGSAKLLGHLQLAAPLPRPPEESWSTGPGRLDPSCFVPPGYALHRGDPIGKEYMVPTYPVGLPVLMCLAFATLPSGIALPSLILLDLLAGIILTYLLARQLGLDYAWALLSAALIALCPVYIFMGLQPMSDVAAAVWVCIALAVALRIGNRPAETASEAGGGSAWARALPLVCGIATGMAVMIRPTNVLMIPALLIAMRFSLRNVVPWALAGLPLGIVDALYNWQLYGRPFMTGYGNVTGLFQWEWVRPTLLHYLIWFPCVLTPVVFLAAGVFFLRKQPLRDRLVLVVWPGAYLCVYASYYFTHETWWYLRFLIPAMPPLVIGALLVLRELWSRTLGNAQQDKAHWRWLFGTAGASALVLWLIVVGSRLPVLDSGLGNEAYSDNALWLATHAPANSVVVCTYTGGAVYYYTSLALVHPADEREAQRILELAGQTHHPLYAMFFKFDQAPLGYFHGGQWTWVHGHGDINVERWDRSDDPAHDTN
jgi:hypothetical protein